MADFTIRENDLLPILSATLTDTNSNPVDLSTALSIVFTLSDLATDTELVHAAATPVDLVHGKVSYVWQIGDTARVGTFYATFLVTYVNGSQTYPTTTDLMIEIAPTVTTPLSLNAWCTPDDVLSTTGNAVNTIDVLQAQIILEGFINRVWRVTDSTHRDFVWLKRAAIYQALYVNSHPELFEMMDVASLQQDVLSTTFRDQASFYVAPISQMFCQRLYRAANATIRLNSAFQKSRRNTVSGAYGVWAPLS